MTVSQDSHPTGPRLADWFDLVFVVDERGSCVHLDGAPAPPGLLVERPEAGRPLEDTLAEPFASRVAEAVRDVRETRATTRLHLALDRPHRRVAVECRPWRTSGADVLCLVSAQPVADPLRGDGDLERARLKATASLDRDALLDVVMADVDQGIVIQGPEAEILMCNPCALELLGLTEAQLLGRTSFDPDWRAVDAEGAPFPGAEHPVPRAIAERSPVRNVRMGVHRPGCDDPVWLNVSAIPQMSPSDDVAFVICNFTDVTSEVEALQRVERERAVLKQVMHTADAGVVLLERNGMIEYANRAAERVLGLEPSQIEGRRYDDPDWHTQTWEGEPWPPEDEPFAVVLRTRRGVRDVAQAICWPDGSRHYLSINGAPVLDEDGEVESVVFTVLDMTERRRRARERDRMLRQVEDLARQESLAVMAGGVAHDFNNLLVGILGASGLALMELDDDHPATPHVEVVETTAQEASNLTRQLLAYSGHGRFETVRVDLGRMVEASSSLLHALVSKRVQLDLDTELETVDVEADANSLRQILINLVLNASESIVGSGGLISIRNGQLAADAAYLAGAVTGRDLPAGRYGWFEVEDNGCGIVADMVGRIFDPFFTTKETGQGLGLSAVLGAVHSQNGFLMVSSAPGRGTTVRVGFPAVSGTTAEAPAPAEAQKRITQLSGRVLVVDDEDLVRVVTERILQRAGAEPVGARDGAEGLQIFADDPGAFDAVVLDITMPGLNGEDVLLELRRMRADIPVLMMSGYTELQVDSALRIANGFIQKPFRPAQLVDVLGEILRARD